MTKINLTVRDDDEIHVVVVRKGRDKNIKDEDISPTGLGLGFDGNFYIGSVTPKSGEESCVVDNLPFGKSPADL